MDLRMLRLRGASSSTSPLTTTSSRNHNLQVFARRHHRAVLCAIEFTDHAQKIALELSLHAGCERAEGLQHGAVVGFEDFHPVLGRAVAECEGALHRFDGARV